MNAIPPLSAERLFTPFLDVVDGTICLPSGATASDINTRVAPHPLRFPLILDDRATILEQVSAATHAPASSRFGPFCDNILGMNWRLPGGRVARIGERVVKSTTGYDWLRFLLHTGTRFGEPVDYVLRLRPDCGFTAVARFDGDGGTLRACVSKLLRGGWMHWWDAVDYLVGNGASFVRVTIHCSSGEGGIFAEQLTGIAAATGATLTLQNDVSAPADGLPDIVIKTTPDCAVALANDLAGDGARCLALCYSGVVHVRLTDGDVPETVIPGLMRPHLAELNALGGDWHSRHVPAPDPGPAEAAWIHTLEEVINER